MIDIRSITILDRRERRRLDVRFGDSLGSPRDFDRERPRQTVAIEKIDATLDEELTTRYHC